MFARLGMLKNERSSWISQWQDLSMRFAPRAGRFHASDRNRGDNRHNKNLDSTGIRALRTLSAGMMSGMTSPARPWLRLATPDREMNERANVKMWLAGFQRLLLDVFARSNTYLALHTGYEELGCFGTHPIIIEDNFERVIHMHNCPTGEYMLAADQFGQVNTIYRDYELPVLSVVEKFGYNNCSQTVRTMYDNGKYDAWVPIYHMIEPRAERDRTKLDAKNKAFKSCYFEGGSDSMQHGLRESGYDEFPALAPRWHRVGYDVYGQSPCMEALGDANQLQHQQLRKGNAIDWQTKPSIQVPVSAKGKEREFMVPGGVLYVDQVGPNNAARNLVDVTLNLQHLLEDIVDVRQRINSSLYADLFLMLVNIDKSGMTATEVAERHEEKLTALGPVLERLHFEKLTPLVERVAAKLVAAGMVPSPPEEMQGMELNVHFISVLAQAQRAIGTNNIDRFVGNIGVIAQFKPGVLDKFDEDAWADMYADISGVPPELVVPSEKVVLIRKAKADAQAEAAKAEQANMAADTAQKLGKVPTGPGQRNAAHDLMNGFTGYGSPTGVEV